MPVNPYTFRYTASNKTVLTFRPSKTLTFGDMEELLESNGETSEVAASLKLIKKIINPKDLDKLRGLPFQEVNEIVEAWSTSEADVDLPKS